VPSGGEELDVGHLDAGIAVEVAAGEVQAGATTVIGDGGAGERIVHDSER
jgi:hypothetical protein